MPKTKKKSQKKKSELTEEKSSPNNIIKFGKQQITNVP